MLDPNRPMAIMEPLQGGPMLYAFKGKVPYGMAYDDEDGQEYPVYPLGLINQDGKLVTAPKYHRVDYFYDEGEQRIIGVAALRGQEITIYQLSGESRVLPCEGYRVKVCPGGRYMSVEAAKPKSMGAWSMLDPLKDGLFDIENNRYIIEPKVGQYISYEGRGVAQVRQYDSIDMQGEKIAERAVNCADGSTYEGDDWRGFRQPMLPKPAEDQRKLPDLMKHFPKSAKPSDYGMPDDRAYAYAQAAVICDDYIIVCAYFGIESLGSELVDSFAVDWNGKKIKNCPLEPYFDSLWWANAGEQGPNYYWIETPTQRGYINTSGNWLFIDETEYNEPS